MVPLMLCAASGHLGRYASSYNPKRIIMGLILKIDLHRANTMWLIEKLSLYLKTIEKALDESRHVDRDRIESYLINSQDDLCNQDEELHVHNLLFKQDFPSKARYSFLTLAYTVLEDRTKALCGEFIKRKLVIGLRLEERSDESHLQSVRRFLPIEYQSTHVASAMWDELFDFSSIRNCIVHANGNPSNMRNPQRFHDIIVKRAGLSLAKDGYINVELAYCQRIVSLMEKFFDAIFEAAGFGPAETVIERT
jgi:hypothetical protein